MPKLTLDEKIAKVTENIAKEEATIEKSREKIKQYKEELKTLSAEKERSFANDIIKLMKEKGLSQEQLISQLMTNKTAESSYAETTVSSPSESSEVEKVETTSTNVSTFSK